MGEVGALRLVSVGPGAIDCITRMAIDAIKQSDVVIGYELYLNWIKPWLSDQEIIALPLTQERERAVRAIKLARAGRKVALVSGGDIGVYAMAALAFEELSEDDSFAVSVIPGITAANACASLLGAPLSHDFATLSLSDLLCSWTLIEDRARHMACADLCVALYNVQSRTRQDGVYKIIRIFLESKAPDTLCGVVKNAHRSDQSAQVTTLAKLLTRKFDMFTTIIIGNSHTKRKGKFIYTTRDLRQTSEQNSARVKSADSLAALPASAIWVFSGTSDGNDLAKQIANMGHPVVVSVASEYGAEAARLNCPGISVVSGRFGAEARKRHLEKACPRAIIDATHPYAASMSKQLMELSTDLRLYYLRFDRSSIYTPGDAEVCDTVEVAASRAMQFAERIFIATGSKDLDNILKLPGASEKVWFARVTPDAASIGQAVAAGIPHSRICAMQGPFSQQFNEALFRDWEIDCVITKDSGQAGGYQEKIMAARQLSIPVLVVRRPELQYPRVASDFDSVVKQLALAGGPK